MTVQKETMQPATSFTVTTFSCCFKLKDFKIYCMYLYLLWVCFGWTVTSFSLNLPSLNHRGHKHNVTVYSNNLGGIRRTLSRSVFSFFPSAIGAAEGERVLIWDVKERRSFLLPWKLQQLLTGTTRSKCFTFPQWNSDVSGTFYCTHFVQTFRCCFEWAHRLEMIQYTKRSR